MTEPNHDENVYALRAHDEKTIHISEVKRKETGRGPGYFCLGCKRQVQAVLSDIGYRKKFFRHDAKAVKGQPKCTYSDETYRHKLSKEIIQRLGKVRIPSLYKYFLDETIQRKHLIQESTFIEASKILIENFLFEDKNGNINYSREIDNKNGHYLFIKPDVIFLDSNGKPILIIELVATHKPKSDKLIKLKRLGINAIQIKIPKDSTESIENIFSQTTNTVWIYNEQEERFTIPVSGAHSEGISELDAIQRGFFEENFTCRQAQIRNLIRGLERLLESEHYGNTVEDFRSEMQRVEENTASHRRQLDELRGKFGESGIIQHSERREELTEKQREFQAYTQGLEERYHTKARELESEESLLEQDITEIEFQEEELNSRGSTARKTIEGQENAIIRIRGEIEELPGIHRIELEQLERKEEKLRMEEDAVERVTESIRRNIGNSQELLRKREEELKYSISTEAERTVAETKRIENEISKLESKYRELEDSTRRNYPRNREEYAERVNNGSFKRGKWFTSEYAKLPELIQSVKIYSALHEELRLLETKNRN